MARKAEESVEEASAAIVRHDGRSHDAARNVSVVPGAAVSAGTGDTAKRRSTGVSLAKLSVATVDVVVNVVYRTTAQNISDAQVASQIKVLNLDYSSEEPRQVPRCPPP